jgi:hypothetical protein
MPEDKKVATRKRIDELRAKAAMGELGDELLKNVVGGGHTDTIVHTDHSDSSVGPQNN